MTGASVFTELLHRSPVPALADDSAYVAVLNGLLPEFPGTNVVFDDIWCHVLPASARHPAQGWKIHVSSTMDAAAGTLAVVAELLLRAGCAFKFASTPDRLRLLNSANYPRGGAGKFVTVYPPDDTAFTELAQRLHQATLGRPGPAVLSDRPYAEGSVVQYRYGAFSGTRLLTDDAELVGAITAPDGRLVPDERNAWYSPPSWAVAPLPQPEAAPPKAGPVLLGGRFAAKRALRQSNRGGVYEAIDQRTGRTVVVKQARRGVLGNTGVAAQDGLRHEARVLTELAPLGHTPAVLDVFEQGTDVFLAEDLVDGEVLRLWIRKRAGVVTACTRTEPGVPVEPARRILRRLTGIVRAVHAAGWVLRDLSPSNVLVDDDERLMLVDVEFAALAGESAEPGGTPGYLAPEQAGGAPAAPEADLFSLGGIAFMLATGNDPAFADDGRRADWLAAAARASATAAALEPLITGLTATDPSSRWPLDRAEEFLSAPTPAFVAASPAVTWSDELADRLLRDGIGHLVAEFDPARSPMSAMGGGGWVTGGPWPRACSTGSMDPANVHHGAAGVLGTLTVAARHGFDVRPVLREGVEWLSAYLREDQRVLPGLHFGRSGTAWALYDIAKELRDDPATALDLAKRIPLDWDNPDLAHGVAGAGLAQLRFWLHTADPVFDARYRACAADLAARAVRHDGAVLWTIPAGSSSKLAGLTHLGLAHGSAGVALFLLEAGLAAERDDWIGIAGETARYLTTMACADDDAVALWPSSADDPADPMEHWCSGASGIGTFLVRHWETTGAETSLALAVRAAEAVHRRRWYAAAVQCHGLAGNGEFLLDLAAATGVARFRRYAEDLAAVAYLRHADRGGRLLVPDETNTGFGTEYGTGGSGFLGFLLRLRHQTSRMWTVHS